MLVAVDTFTTVLRDVVLAVGAVSLLLLLTICLAVMVLEIPELRARKVERRQQRRWDRQIRQSHWN